MLHVVPLYDILNKCYLDVELQPIRRRNEFRAFCSLMDRFGNHEKTKPIFIADRGFCSYNVFAHAMENHASFLVRAKDVFASRLLGKTFLAGSLTFPCRGFSAGPVPGKNCCIRNGLAYTNLSVLILILTIFPKKIRNIPCSCVSSGSKYQRISMKIS